jgi:hypothetical protein
MSAGVDFNVEDSVDDDGHHRIQDSHATSGAVATYGAPVLKGFT